MTQPAGLSVSSSSPVSMGRIVWWGAPENGQKGYFWVVEWNGAFSGWQRPPWEEKGLLKAPWRGAYTLKAVPSGDIMSPKSLTSTFQCKVSRLPVCPMNFCRDISAAKQYKQSNWPSKAPSTTRSWAGSAYSRWAVTVSAWLCFCFIVLVGVEIHDTHFKCGIKRWNIPT